MSLPDSAASTPRYDVAELRAQEFPWTSGTTYLNNASTGPLPAGTVCALHEFLRRRTNPSLLPDPDLQAVLAESRRLLAQLINASVAEIALAPNTTYGLNLAATGLPLQAGDVVLVSDKEFPANVYPWLRLEERGIGCELVPTTPEGWPDAARIRERLADPRVRVLALSLVQFGTGYLADLAYWSAATRETDTYLVVDAIQGLGYIPVDLALTEVDILSAGGQKWLLSPWGSGFVYVRKGLRDVVQPSATGWMAYEGSQDFTRLTSYDDRLLPDARRFELVTLPFQDFAGLNASVSLLLSLGIEAIQRHIDGVLEPIRHWCGRQGVPLRSPLGAHGSAIVCVAPSDPVEAHRLLRAEGVVSSLREGSIRLSPHCYNTVDEMERVVAVLERVGTKATAG
ncbi:MAG TPA: aminotransferase class V-fold PLP-dependent enzyme [Gemmatimonadales bacterium]|nr:aminotransferase class V-fold PLP-dependent enzyme [Gemmatimonadales bacterium]